ncbi:hypothetical protein BDF22DRAFT_702607 [Syncephalis plumigaleata]|nr:hypothetical protein BDF22DRAFT_702607 [Syncephalis plumigaleata]
MSQYTKLSVIILVLALVFSSTITVIQAARIYRCNVDGGEPCIVCIQSIPVCKGNVEPTLVSPQTCCDCAVYKCPESANNPDQKSKPLPITPITPGLSDPIEGKPSDNNEPEFCIQCFHNPICKPNSCKPGQQCIKHEPTCGTCGSIECVPHY